MPKKNRTPPRKPESPPEGWLWSQDAADYLGVHVVTLNGWRRDGTAPKSVLHGRRRYAYKISDLDAWLNGDRAKDDQPHRARSAA